MASPLPNKIIEINVIKNLLENNNLVIAVGGGGIPVIKTGQNLTGISAVIDKDRSSSLLAHDLKADMLLILTTVDKVMINYKKENQKEIDEMTIKVAKKYIDQWEFAPGSMLPKIEACIDFVEKSDEGVALITSLEKASEALEKKTGTVIRK